MIPDTIEEFFTYVRREEWEMSNGLSPTIGWMRGYFDRYYGKEDNGYPENSLAWSHYNLGQYEAERDYLDV